MSLDWNLVQGSHEWHKARSGTVGSSEVACLFGVQAGYAMSAFTLFQVKSGIIPPPYVDDRPGTRVWRGKRLEPILGEMAAEQFKWKIRKGPFATDDECPGMSASLDFWIDEPGEEERHLGFEGPGNLEIKEAQWLQHRKEWTDSEPPFQIVLQNQTACAAAGLSWGVVVVDVSEIGLLAYRYAARSQTAALIRRKIGEFWQHVREGRAPSPDGTASTAAALREMFPGHREAPTLDLLEDSDADVTAAAFLMARAHKKESEKIYQEQRNLLLWKLQGNNQGETANHWISVDKKNAVNVVEKKRI